MHPLRPVSVSGHSKGRFPVQRDLEGAASHRRRAKVNGRARKRMDPTNDVVPT